MNKNECSKNYTKDKDSIKENEDYIRNILSDARCGDILSKNKSGSAIDITEMINIDEAINKKLATPSFIKTNNKVSSKLCTLKRNVLGVNRFKSGERGCPSKHKINLKSDEILQLLRSNNERNNSIDVVLSRARKIKENNISRTQTKANKQIEIEQSNEEFISPIKL